MMEHRGHVLHVLVLLLLLHQPCLLLSVEDSDLSSESSFRLTGRKATLHTQAALDNPDWHKAAHVIPLFHPGTNTTTSPLPPIAYGGTLSSFTYHLHHHKDAGEEIEELVAFAHGQGLFTLLPTNATPGSCSINEEAAAGLCSVVEDEAVVPSSLEIINARRLLCEVALDGPLCEQPVFEAVFDGGGQGAGRRRHKKGWIKGPSTGSIVFIELHDREHERQHHVTISRDSSGHLAIFQHTFFPMTPAPFSLAATASLPSTFSFLTYNVWHNQPGAWLYPDPNKRWHKYWERLAYLAAVVWASGADVCGFQEVRYYDQTFGAGNSDQHLGLQHLLDLLAALDAGRQTDKVPSASPPPPFQFIYQPAMSFTAHNGHHVREDQGVALLSRYPIRRSEYLLLPRDFGDPHDGHQRICLYAEVEPTPRGPLVGVYVTHFSLSASMREAAVASILEWAAEHKKENDNLVAQVLLGDLNAEPHERSVKMLTKEDEFSDAWVETHPMPFVDEEEEDDKMDKNSGESGRMENGEEALARRNRRIREAYQASFTFPTCQPVKRIDYVLYRGSIRPVEVSLWGREPTEESKDRASPGGGMLEPDGPVFASDHLAVLTRFESTAHKQPETET